ncbi:MAG: hypothetical protein GXY36_11945 [Chloroflexi bacterium]|nr:hypothetical protein [Chloroflexota bacterium]
MVSQSDLSDYGTFQQRVTALYMQERYAEALELANAAQEHFSENENITYYLRACLSSMVGQGDQALALLRTALDAGYWYPDLFWNDTDFDSIRDRPEFQALRERSDRQQDTARTNARPEMPVELPGGAGPFPALMALHGNMHSAAIDAPNWRPVLKTGWLLALPQASEPAGKGMFVWDNREQSEAELLTHYARLVEEYPVDLARVILGGFSMGAETALYLALKGALPVRGVLAVAPGGPYTRQPELWQPLIDGARGRGLRIYLIMGGRDVAAAQTRELAEMLRAGGIVCELEDHAEMGHIFPPDFRQRVPDLLRWILGEA